MKAEQDRVKALLVDTITLLCKNGLTFLHELKVQGLLGITIDDSDVFVVHINESYASQGAEKAEISLEPSAASFDRSQSQGNVTVSVFQPCNRPKLPIIRKRHRPLSSNTVGNNNLSVLNRAHKYNTNLKSLVSDIDKLSEQAIIKDESEDKDISKPDVMLIDSDEEIIALDRQHKKRRHRSNEHGGVSRMSPETSFCPTTQQTLETAPKLINTRSTNDITSPPRRNKDDASDTRLNIENKRIHSDWSKQRASRVKTEPEHFLSACVSFSNKGDWSNEVEEAVYHEGDDVKDDGRLSGDQTQQLKWESNDYDDGTFVDYFNDSSLLQEHSSPRLNQYSHSTGNNLQSTGNGALDVIPAPRRNSASTSSKPFPCHYPQCGKRFFHETNARRHEREAHHLYRSQRWIPAADFQIECDISSGGIM